MLVSICCPAFNQEDMISQALDGFLSQKTDFDFEIIIYDDASSDNNTRIIKEYKLKNPNIIKPIYAKENQYTKGKKLFADCLFPYVTGKYIALCDGDDYWINTLKLQKQIDFLEKNRDFMGCSHNTKILNTKIKDKSLVVNLLKKDIFTIADLTKGQIYFHTSAMVYRNDFKQKEIYEYLSKAKGDWFISMCFAQYGPIKYIDEVMSVYRIHEKGIWSLLNEEEKVLKNLKAVIEFNKIFEYKYEDNFLKLFTRISISNSNNRSKFIKKLFITIDKDDIIRFLPYLYDSISMKEQVIQEKEQVIQEKEQVIQEKEQIIQEKEIELKNIYSSKTWKLVALLKKITILFKRKKHK